MSITRTPSNASTSGVDVAWDRQVEQDEWGATAPAERGTHHARVDHRFGGAGGRHHQVRAGDRRRQLHRDRRAHAVLARPGRARAPANGSPRGPAHALGRAGASRRARPSVRRRRRRRPGPRRSPSASVARSAPSATNASGAAPSDVSARARRPARAAAWNSERVAGPACPLGLGARGTPRGPARGSASRRSPWSPTPRPHRRDGRRRPAPSASRAVRPVPQGRPRASRSGTASAPGTRRGTRGRSRRSRLGCRWTGSPPRRRPPCRARGDIP